MLEVSIRFVLRRREVVLPFENLGHFISARIHRTPLNVERAFLILNLVLIFCTVDLYRFAILYTFHTEPFILSDIYLSIYLYLFIFISHIFCFIYKIYTLISGSAM